MLHKQDSLQSCVLLSVDLLCWYIAGEHMLSFCLFSDDIGKSRNIKLIHWDVNRQAERWQWTVGATVEEQPVEEQPVEEHDPLHCGFGSKLTGWCRFEVKHKFTLHSLVMAALSAISETALLPTTSKELGKATRLQSLKRHSQIFEWLDA